LSQVVVHEIVSQLILLFDNASYKKQAAKLVTEIIAASSEIYIKHITLCKKEYTVLNVTAGGTQSVHFTVSLNTAAVMGAMQYRKPASADKGKVRFSFARQPTLSYTGKSQTYRPSASKQASHLLQIFLDTQ
jgi:hypothetical protein